MSLTLFERTTAIIRGVCMNISGVPLCIGTDIRPSKIEDSYCLEFLVKDIEDAKIAAAFEHSLLQWIAAHGPAAGIMPGVIVISDAKGQSRGLYLGLDLSDVRDSLEIKKLKPAMLVIAESKSDSGRVAHASKYKEALARRIALVTGGAQGFGEEITRSLIASGAIVHIADINLEGATRLAKAINKDSGKEVCIPHGVDVANEAMVAALVSSIMEQTGGLDLVVSNAGILRAGSVLDQSLNEFQLVTNVNYLAFFLLCKHCAAILKAQHYGNPQWYTDIIQINSKSGLEGSNRNAAYAGSKFGGIGLVQSFALELVEYNIKVNAICPGNFFDGPLWSDPDTGLFVQYLRSQKVPGARTIKEVREAYEAKVPMKRGCNGEDVMRALRYLVEQHYETGQALPVTGGQVMLN